jgi:hypothetical protein
MKMSQVIQNLLMSLQVWVQTKIFTNDEGNYPITVGERSAWIIAEFFVTDLKHLLYAEQDPVDWLGILGEVGGFWEMSWICIASHIHA